MTRYQTIRNGIGVIRKRYDDFCIDEFIEKYYRQNA